MFTEERRKKLDQLFKCKQKYPQEKILHVTNLNFTEVSAF